MFPFFVKGEKMFSFSYKPRKGGAVKDDDTGKWYEIQKVDESRGRKVYGKETVNWDNPDWKPM